MHGSVEGRCGRAEPVGCLDCQGILSEIYPESHPGQRLAQTSCEAAGDLTIRTVQAHMELKQYQLE